MPGAADDKAAWLAAAMAKVTAEPRYSVESYPAAETVPTLNGGLNQRYLYRCGVTVYVIDNRTRVRNRQVAWKKDVWRRGLVLNFRPFYNRRLARTLKKAEKRAQQFELGKQKPGYLW